MTVSNGGGFLPSRARTWTFVLLGVAIAFSVYLIFSWESLPVSYEQLKNQYCSIEQTQDSSVEKTQDSVVAPVAQQAPHRCLDPYRQPGFLHLDTANGDYNQTRWIPFSTDFLDAPDPVSAEYPYDVEGKGDLWFDENSSPEDAYLDHALTPSLWMNAAIEESRGRVDANPNQTAQSTFKWMDGRVVLLISDSVDRYNMQFFCGEFRDRADSGARFKEHKTPHSVATCIVPSLNFTMIHWHLASMMTYTPHWWYDIANMHEVAFEERWEKVWSKTFNHLASINGRRPDLILWNSVLWDRKSWSFAAKDHYGAKTPMAKYTRPLNWGEVRFYAARVKKLLHFLQERFGEDVPMMLRTTTLDQISMAKDVQSYTMDRLSRAMSKKFGLEVFEWGKIIAGHADLYRDNLHPGKGASSWLWATMVLEYLARAVGAGTQGGARAEREPYFDSWQACHESLVTT